MVICTLLLFLSSDPLGVEFRISTVLKTPRQQWWNYYTINGNGTQSNPFCLECHTKTNKFEMFQTIVSSIHLIYIDTTYV